MKRNSVKISLVAFYLWAVLLTASASFAIVTHPDDPVIGIGDIPDANVIGRWASSSCVVINPNYVLTARHITGDIGTTVTIAQTNYIVAQIAYIGTADLRVTRITTPAGAPANLTNTVALNNDINNEASKTNLAIGGFGKGRGATLYNDSSEAYGYLWAGNNTVLRWGSNRINGYLDADANRPSAVIYGYFDAPGVRPYEAMPAKYDSGGGWFIKKNSGGTWKVAGILQAVEHIGKALYNDPDAGAGDPRDYFEAVRVYTYHSQIEDIYDTPKIISGYVTNDGNGVENVNVATDNVAGFTRTNSDGYYELWVPSSWSGVITPSKDALIFDPASRDHTNVTSNLSDKDYSVRTVSISGHIFESANPVVDVNVIANSNGGSSITDTNGFYDLSVISSWSGEVAAAKISYIFSPNSVTYENITSDVNGADYIAYIDINNDSFVDWLDVKMLHEEWLSSGESLAADVTDDNSVNFEDFAKFANGW